MPFFLSRVAQDKCLHGDMPWLCIMRYHRLCCHGAEQTIMVHVPRAHGTGARLETYRILSDQSQPRTGAIKGWNRAAGLMTILIRMLDANAMVCYCCRHAVAGSGRRIGE